MSVAATTRKQQFSLNGTTATLTFTFRALPSAPTDIKVTVTDGDGDDTALVYTTDYTVAVDADGVGGVVTLVSPSSVGSGTATVYRDTTNLQESDYDNYNQFPADTLELDLDIRTLVAQEQSEDLDRALVLPISYTGTVSTTVPTPSAGAVLGWNSGGTGLENKTLAAFGATEIATQAEAEAGTNNVDYMTALRVAQAMANGPTLTAAPTSDQTASGMRITLNCGENFSFGQIGYINTAGVVMKADADAIATSNALFMALGTVTISSSSAGTLLIMGVVRNDSWTLTVGSLVYLSTTAGAITQDQPSGTDDVIQILGFATHADRMVFKPELNYITHT
jgi:hypothetical protein